MPQFARRACRPRDHVEAAGGLYPDAWRLADVFRAGRGTQFPAWPDWCYLPITAAATIVAEDAGIDIRDLPMRYPERMADAARLASLVAWRVTQGIYRFDQAVYDAVRETPVSGDLPHDVLYRLPEWCIYVETPGMQSAGALHGFFAHLEYDLSGRVELRLLLDCEAALLPLPLHLGAWSLSESIERTVAEARRQALQAGIHTEADLPALPGVQSVAHELAPLVSLLLYLCSQASEIGDGTRRPGNPAPKRVRGAWRLFAADRPTTWDVGVRLGAALRRAYQAEQTAGDSGTHAGPRPHIRRAHWHGFWRGPLAGPREYDLRWLPPIAVGVADPGDLPAVVRRVGP